MENGVEEPHKSVPVPSPHPSSGLEESSALLELTPEKPARRRRIKRPVQLKQHDIRDVENGHDHNTGNENVVIYVSSVVHVYPYACMTSGTHTDTLCCLFFR